MTLERAAQLADTLAEMAGRIPDNDVPPGLFRIFAAACRELHDKRHARVVICHGDPLIVSDGGLKRSTDAALEGCEG